MWQFFYSVVALIVSYKYKWHLTAKIPRQTANFPDIPVKMEFPDIPWFSRKWEPWHHNATFVLKWHKLRTSVL